MAPILSFLNSAAFLDFRPTLSCLTPWLIVTGAVLLLLFRNRPGR